jgi:uncharacterized protein (DUF486 family)
MKRMWKDKGILGNHSPALSVGFYKNFQQALTLLVFAQGFSCFISLQKPFIWTQNRHYCTASIQLLLAKIPQLPMH